MTTEDDINLHVQSNVSGIGLMHGCRTSFLGFALLVVSHVLGVCTCGSSILYSLHDLRDSCPNIVKKTHVVWICFYQVICIWIVKALFAGPITKT